METEEATKPSNEDQSEVPSLDQSKNAIQNVIEESKAENQTNGTETASNGENPKNPVEQEDKKRKESEKESPRRDDGPSKRVREGQKWNDRPRKHYGNQNDRPHKRHNNKADLVSQEESSDPVAIRKQVCTSRCYLCSFLKPNDHVPGRILLFGFQPSDGQISIYKSRRP